MQPTKNMHVTFCVIFWICAMSLIYGKVENKTSNLGLSAQSDFEEDYLIMAYLCLHPYDGDTPALASMGQTSA